MKKSSPNTLNLHALRDWLEPQLGPLSDDQLITIVEILKDDFKINEGISSEEVDLALNLLPTFKRIQEVLPLCARLVASPVKTTQSISYQRDVEGIWYACAEPNTGYDLDDREVEVPIDTKKE